MNEARHGNQGETQSLEAVLSNLGDELWHVRQAAVEALGRSRDPRAIEPLIVALGDIDTDVQEAAARALQQIANVPDVELRFEPELRKRIEHALATRREFAEAALAKRKQAEDAERLAKQVADQTARIERERELALSAMPGPWDSARTSSFVSFLTAVVTILLILLVIPCGLGLLWVSLFLLMGPDTRSELFHFSLVWLALLVVLVPAILVLGRLLRKGQVERLSKKLKANQVAVLSVGGFHLLPVKTLRGSKSVEFRGDVMVLHGTPVASSRGVEVIGGILAIILGLRLLVLISERSDSQNGASLYDMVGLMVGVILLCAGIYCLVSKKKGRPLPSLSLASHEVASVLCEGGIVTITLKCPVEGRVKSIALLVPPGFRHKFFKHFNASFPSMLPEEYRAALATMEHET